MQLTGSSMFIRPLVKLIFLVMIIEIKKVQSIECFDCTNFPSQITCTETATCEGVGCYFTLNTNASFWTASCSNSIAITDRQTSCYKIPDGDEYCVCFTDFCNTPAEIEKAVDLRHTPFTSDLKLPWNEPTTANPRTTSPTKVTIILNTIPTMLLLGKAQDAPPPPENTPNSAAAQPGIGKLLVDGEIQQEVTTNAPITSTEPHIHYSNFSTQIDNSTESTGKIGDGGDKANKTALDNSMDSVTEINFCQKSFYGTSFIFLIFTQLLNYIVYSQ